MSCPKCGAQNYVVMCPYCVEHPLEGEVVGSRPSPGDLRFVNRPLGRTLQMKWTVQRLCGAHGLVFQDEWRDVPTINEQEAKP